MLDDDVLTRLCESLGKAGAAPALLAAKGVALQNSINASGPIDDFKRIAGDTYIAAKQQFQNQKLGSNKRAFMKGFCAPLIQPGTTVYQSPRSRSDGYVRSKSPFSASCSWVIPPSRRAARSARPNARAACRLVALMVAAPSRRHAVEYRRPDAPDPLEG
jgi:hypothetical protein